MKLQFANFIIYILIIVASIVFFNNFPALVVIIANLIFFLVFIYNIFFFWIISKAKPGSPMFDFFSTSGRMKIKKNMDLYFDERYAGKYRIIANASYFVPLIFLLAILIFIFIV